MGEADLHHAGLFATQDAALDWLEAFDPNADLAPGFDASGTGAGRGTPPGALARHAVAR